MRPLDRITAHIRQRIRRAVTTFVFSAVTLYMLGFIIFAASLDRHAPSDVTAADAIVALTGGEGRITEAMKLLDDGKGARLLITGVHPEVKSGTIKNTVNVPSAKFDCCVDLGRQAEDTIGNATETASWVRTHGYRSIILVTSTYHMPRAALELRGEQGGVVDAHPPSNCAAPCRASPSHLSPSCRAHCIWTAGGIFPAQRGYCCLNIPNTF